MEEGTKISDHMSILNGIISDLEAIGVVIFDEDKALCLIWSLSTSYEHVKSILMYEKDTMIYLEVSTKLLYEERRLGSKIFFSIVEHALVVKEGKKKNFRKVVFWACGQSGHIKKKCPKGGAGSTNGFDSQTNTITFDDEIL